MSHEEWGILCDWTQEFVLSEPGSELLELTRIGNTRAKSALEANQAQQTTAEAIRLLDKKTLWGALADLGNPLPALESISPDHRLGHDDLFLLSVWISAIHIWGEFARSPSANLFPIFRSTISKFNEYIEIDREFSRVFEPGTGAILDQASSKLQVVRKRLRTLHQQLQAHVQQLVQAYEANGILQNSSSDQIDGQYLLSVKASRQSEVKGSLIYSSTSGQTVFIEPQELVQLRNEVKQTEAEEVAEIDRILWELHKLVWPEAKNIKTSIQNLAHWDSIYARAQLAEITQSAPVLVTEDRRFLLLKVVHPLLIRSLGIENVVRNSFEWAEPKSTLLISGPNTGGKTVLLKTIGLISQMAVNGFFIPCSDGSEIPFFEQIFYDLGDPQSIEQHLSSFSGHIRRLIEVCEKSSPRSLVLLDELNASTDPSEGLALSRVILEHLHERGALVVCTSHDPSLKALGYNHPNVLIASVGFDESREMPTYQIRIGIPGRSRALETARRLGFPENLLNRAKSYVGTENIRIEDMIQNLEKKLEENEQTSRKLRHLEKEAETLKAEYSEKIRSQSREIYDRSRAKIKKLLEQASDEIKIRVKTINESKKETTSETLVNFEKSVNQQIIETLQEDAPDSEFLNQQDTILPEETWKIGDLVRIIKINSFAVILEVKGEKIRVSPGHSISTGRSGMSMNLKKTEVTRLTESEIRTIRAQQKFLGLSTSKRPLSNISFERSEGVPRQIDIRGKRHDDAMSILAKYLDEAFRAGHPEIDVIHGLGTGALKMATNELLKKLVYVDGYRDAGPGAGGSGATRVAFTRTGSV